jgi:hypothetical protein
MLRYTKRPKVKEHALRVPGTRRRLFCVASALAALVLSLAAADVMTGSLLDSIALVSGVLAVRDPRKPLQPTDRRVGRIRRTGFEAGRDPFVGVQNLN